MPIMIIALIAGYVVGCIQVAYVIGRVFGKIDIREHGSGNAGTTNVTRVLGAKAGLIVFALDILKGVIAFMLGAYVLSYGEFNIVLGLYAGFGAVLGHNFPFYLKFKGGKGIATTIGVMLSFNPIMAFTIFGICTVVVILTKYISAASLVMMLLFPVGMYMLNYYIEAVLIGGVLMVLAYYQHRGNIKRILDGTERKFSFKKKGTLNSGR